MTELLHGKVVQLMNNRETLKCLHENIRRFNNLESNPVDLILSGASGRMGREILKLVMEMISFA